MKVLRRSFLKFAAAALLHPVLNWQFVPFEQAVREVFYCMTMYIYVGGDVYFNNRKVDIKRLPCFQPTDYV